MNSRLSCTSPSLSLCNEFERRNQVREGLHHLIGLTSASIIYTQEISISAYWNEGKTTIYEVSLLQHIISLRFVTTKKAKMEEKKLSTTFFLPKNNKKFWKSTIGDLAEKSFSNAFAENINIADAQCRLSLSLTHKDLLLRFLFLTHSLVK